MKDDLKIAAAEAEVERARTELIGTLNEMAAYFQPDLLIDQAWETAKNKGADLAERAVDAVTSKPLVIGGALAAVAAFFAREPIKDAAVKAFDVMTSSSDKKAKEIKGAAKVEPVTTKPVAKPATRKAAARKPIVRRRKSVEKSA
nr:hypothetical protein [uncultured Sphingomonas sp.]